MLVLNYYSNVEYLNGFFFIIPSENNIIINTFPQYCIYENWVVSDNFCFFL